MIALTQEKREELKVFISASIEQRCTVYTLTKQRELEELRDQVALASLIAEPEYARLFGDTGDTLVRCHHKSEGRIAMFTAPPLPEIKLPSDSDFDSWFKSVEAGDDTGWQEPAYQSVEWYQYLSRRQLAKGVFNFYADEIKRLNGLGE